MMRIAIVMMLGIVWMAPAHAEAQANPFNVRVTIDYRAAPAAEVIAALSPLTRRISTEPGRLLAVVRITLQAACSP